MNLLTFSGLELPDRGDSTGSADWAEAVLLLSGRESVSRTALRRALRSQLFPEEGLGSEDLGRNDLDVELELLLAEVQRREQACAESYPFRSAGGNLAFTAVASGLAYIFLLAISVSLPLRSERRYAEVDEHFDNLVLQALINYLGAGARAVRFGWPASGDRPKTFGAAIKWLARQLGMRQGAATPRRSRKDGGADVVAWAPFPDAREAFIVILAQCTVMVRWQLKYRDLVIDHWRGWIDFRKDPLTCLAIPFVVPDVPEHWDELCRGVHIVLDRVRLAELCRGDPKYSPARIWEWTSNELSRMGATEAVLPERWRPQEAAE